MGLLASTKLDTLDDLFLHEIEDLYDAENRILGALPKMRDAASSAEVRTGFERHIAETEGQIKRLEQIFSMIGKSPKRETCEAAKGLIKEGSEIVNATGDDDVKDAALIGAGQRVEHYEIAGYGTARNLAQRLGLSDAATLLEQTLEEEKRMDRMLTQVAEQSINPAAAAAR